MEMAKHKLAISNPTAEKFIHKHYFRSIRNKVLQKLVLLFCNFWLSREQPLYQEITKRLNEQGLSNDLCNIVYELKPEDVMPIIGCSKRTAVEYIQALRVLCG